MNKEQEKRLGEDKLFASRVSNVAKIVGEELGPNRAIDIATAIDRISQLLYGTTRGIGSNLNVDQRIVGACVALNAVAKGLRGQEINKPSH